MQSFTNFRSEWRERMNYLLDALPPRQKEVMYYRYVEGMDLPDICKLMEMNYQSVQNLIQRSIKKVKGFLAGKGKTATNIRLLLANYIN